MGATDVFRAWKVAAYWSGVVVPCLALALLGCGAETEPEGGSSSGTGGTNVGGAGGSSSGTGGVGATGGAGGSSSGTGGTGGQDDCPPDVVCVTTFPFNHAGTTTGAASDQIDSYACAATTDESGPEVVYRVDLPEDGFLALELGEPLDPGVDIDVHLMSELDGATCLDRGHWRAGKLLAAGRYWVTADTWVEPGPVEHDGSYTLTFGLTTVSALTGMGVDAGVGADALHAFDVAWAAGEAGHFSYAVTDFSLPSDQRRLWLLDLAQGSLRHHFYVAHGEMSADPNDSKWAVSFSNVSAPTSPAWA